MGDSPDDRDTLVLSKNGKTKYMKRLLIGLPLVLLVCLVATGWWLLRTDAGAGWAWSKLERSEAAALSSAGTDGNFADGFRIQGLVYRSADVDVLVGQAELKAGPGWWPLSIHIRELSLRDISVNLHPQAAGGEEHGDEADISAILSALKLPLPLEIHDARLTNVNLKDGDQQPVKLVDSLSLEVLVDEKLTVSRLDINGPQFE